MILCVCVAAIATQKQSTRTHATCVTIATMEQEDETTPVHESCRTCE